MSFLIASFTNVLLCPDMVDCNSCLKRFHLSCLKLTEKPKKYFCPDCIQKYNIDPLSQPTFEEIVELQKETEKNKTKQTLGKFN